MMIGRILKIVLLSSVLAACSWTDWVKPFVPGNDGISVDAQVGDRNATLGDKNEVVVEDVKGDVNVTTKTEESEYKFNQVETVQIDNVPLIIILLMILGWLMPTPSNMWKVIKDAWKNYRMERRTVGSGSSGYRTRSTTGSGVRSGGVYCPRCFANVRSGASCNCDKRNLRG